jgi:hypothetical protein
MPALSDHMRQIERSIRFLNDCEQEKCGHTREYSEWGVVVRFYIAMHIVEAMLSTDGKHSRNHGERNRNVMVTHQMFSPRFRQCYADIYSLSRTARYLERYGRSVEQFEAIAAGRHLNAIRNEGRAFLAQYIASVAQAGGKQHRQEIHMSPLL